MKKSSETEFLRYQADQAHKFIHGLKRRATGYGSDFSEGVAVDCEAFFRDNPPPKEKTHVVISRYYLKRLQDCALERLKLQAQLRKNKSTSI